MGIVMLNGVKYGGISGGSGCGDYARKPLTLFEGRLTSGSKQIDLSPYWDYINEGLNRSLTTCSSQLLYSGYIDGIYILIRIIGMIVAESTIDSSPSGSFFEESFLAVPKNSNGCLYCGSYSHLACFGSNLFNNELRLYPKDSSGNKVTSNGHVALTLQRTGACYYNVQFNISLSNASSNVLIQKIELL